jgi:NADH:ubiquinone oxidoreductase subunit B-like Fe-S oxidoreductase
MDRLFVADFAKQGYLFAEGKPKDAVLLGQCQYNGFYYFFLYEVLRSVQQLFG